MPSKKPSNTKLTIFVGSTNPVKIEAVKRAAQWEFDDLVVVGYEVTSDISEQPMSDEETRQGATNRAKAALKTGLAESKKKGETYLGMGLEGGVLIDTDEQMWTTVWAVLVTEDGELFEANGACIKVPEIVAQKIRQGEEMGPIMKQLTGLENVKKREGMFGVITKNYVDRTEEYSNIAKSALGIWYGRDWAADLPQ